MKTLINWISFQLYFLHYNMDRQAFKQRMQQLKQYREQNPGKTYLDFKKYAEGGEIPPNNKPIIPEEPQPYKGKLYKDRYGRKYTEDQLADYYDNSSDEIDRFTGKPFVRGLKPVGDIEDAANATPVGDAISAYDTYQVKTQFGDDYIQAYADIINLYNENPLELPNVERLNSGNSRARMQRNSNGTYSYKLDPDIADISAPVTEHELSHYADFKRNLDRPDPHGDSNMFYQMKKDISGRKIDSRDDYYSLPTEQKAHMNQLREYMFQNNYISTREETVDEKLLKKAIQEADKLDSMRGVARASRQFKSFNKYTKWFNSIPLLSIGAAAVYNNNQEK